MLSPEAFAAWCERTEVSVQARSLIDRIRSSSPARRVGGGRSNVSGRYPSRKMGVTIQFESHRVELAGIYEMEHDPDVLEFFDQPITIKLDYESLGGRRVGVMHTPDFFVIRTRNAGWEEWKTEDEILRLAERCPNRYVLSEDGHWRCPPGETQAKIFELYYRVRSSRGINWVYQRNIQYLEDYLRFDSEQLRAGVRETVIALVSTNPGIRLSELFTATMEQANRDEIHTLIALGEIHIDLTSAPLVEADKIRVYPDQRAEARQPDWNGNQPGEALSSSSVGSSPDCASVLAAMGLLPHMSPKHMAEANRRLEQIQAYVAQQPLADGVSSRTVRRWLQRYRQAEAALGDGYSGLLPRFDSCGNRGSKLPEKTQVLMSESIDRDYETPKQKRKFQVYGALVRACETEGTPAPSYKTFSEAVNRRQGYEVVLRRRGRRAAYQIEPPYLELELTTPRHGDRPFHICHIDHTELDVELLCSSTNRNLGRPWWTILIDAFSRRLLAFFLSFDPPSYRSCMMVLRDCVRQYGRLPQILVVDGGKEFESVYFETLLARYECTKKTRPPAKPRFGSICERLFGSSTQLIYCLSGNTQSSRNVRQMTKSVDPKNHAIWTLERLHERLCEWAYEFYDTTVHPALGQTPRDCFELGLQRAGQRLHRQIAYNEEFRMMTLPTTARGTALVHPGKGVKINHLHYWTNAFRDPTIEHTRVPVRYDPYDAGIAWAYVGNRWVSCFCEYFSSFRERSEREMMLAAAELRERSRSHSREFQVTAKRLADFIASVEAEEALLLQRLRDSAAKRIHLENGEPVTALERGGVSEGGCSPVPEPQPDLQRTADGHNVQQQPEMYEAY